MSVLIKGMKMPMSCAECRFKGHGGINEFIEWCDLTGKRLGYYDNRKAKWQTERKPFCPLVEVSEDAVSPCEVCPLVKEMNENVDELLGELYGEDGSLKPRYCDRNICASNEVNGIGCDECEVTNERKV